MLKALTTSATGLEAQQAKINNIANDLANVNTDGYKRDTTEFEDLMYDTIREPGARQGASTTTPVGIQTGMGVKVGATHKIFEQGPAKITNNPYDIMVEGKGFIPVTLPNTGETVFTRAGAFKLDSQGRISLSGGALLQPPVTVPPTTTSVVITPAGEIKAYDQAGGEAILGQIQLVNFTNMQGLSAIGGNFFKATSASGQPLQSVPGENGMGTVMQGALEASNVNVANSMVDMIGAQRGYEMNTRVMTVADKMLEATSNIVR